MLYNLTLCEPTSVLITLLQCNKQEWKAKWSKGQDRQREAALKE